MIAYARFGDQRGLINLMRQHRWGYKAPAEEIGVSRQRLCSCAHGIVAPSPEMRTKLSNFFNVTPGELFSPEALAAKFNEGKAGGGRNRWRGAGAK